MAEMEICRQKLEAKYRMPLVFVRKGGPGTAIEENTSCTPGGGYFSSRLNSWLHFGQPDISADTGNTTNLQDAETCANRLRALGYDAQVAEVPSRIGQPNARVTVGPPAKQE